MKECPSCGNKYADTTLLYCLADGTRLEEPIDELQTLVNPVSSTARTVRVDIPRPTATVVESRLPYPAPARSRSGGNLLKVLLVIVGLAVAAGLAVVGGGIIYYAATRPDSPSSNYLPPTPQPSPASTRDEQAELREQIADLEKRLNEQRRTGQETKTPLKMPVRSSTTITAVVDSPGDGFLALRSLPNSEAGERILKIPHGATVTIGGCGPVVTPVKRSGRWCQASYGGYEGWVFDAYLRY